jgi:nucleoid-associated protein YgaU
MVAPALAQPPDPNKRDEDLMKTEADARILEWQGKVKALQADIDGVNSEIATMNQQMEQAKADTKKCREDIYALVGATEAQVQDFRERLGKIESRVREIGRMSDDQIGAMFPELKTLEDQLTAMRREKIAVLPEFYNRIISIQKEINDIRGRRSSNQYTVGTWAKDRDCLWNIAGKEQIYNDPFMWPKIWQANTDKIRNPDLIYPGQVLTIPAAGPKTDEELRAERLYYRKRKISGRRAASERSTPVDQRDAGSGGR